MNIDIQQHPSRTSLRHPRTDPPAIVDHQVRAYRRQRRRRIIEEQKRQSTGRSRTEADEIIYFAHIWAPYGGAPAADTFETFGLTRRHFIEKLWRTVEVVGCDPSIVRQLALAYPPQRSHSSLGHLR